METLKPLAEVTEPDIRNTYFVVNDTSTRARKLTLKDLHDEAAGITLNETVPEAIRSHFAQAQNLAVYSWFHYPFNVTSQFMSFVTVELALKNRLNSKATAEIVAHKDFSAMLTKMVHWLIACIQAHIRRNRSIERMRR